MHDCSTVNSVIFCKLIRLRVQYVEKILGLYLDKIEIFVIPEIYNSN